MKLLGRLMGTCVVVLLFISACSPTVPKGRVQFDLNTRKQLGHTMNKLEGLDKITFGDTTDRNLFFEPNIYIRNVLTNAWIIDTTHLSRLYDMYEISRLSGFSYIIYTNGNQFTLVDIPRLDYEQLVKMVFRYFKKNPNIDRRLLPLWLQRTTRLWLANHRSVDQYGPWHRFYNRKPQDREDSLMMEYRQYYVPSVSIGVIDAPADSTVKCNPK